MPTVKHRFQCHSDSLDTSKAAYLLLGTFINIHGEMDFFHCILNNGSLHVNYMYHIQFNE